MKGTQPEDVCRSVSRSVVGTLLSCKNCRGEMSTLLTQSPSDSSRGLRVPMFSPLSPKLRSQKHRFGGRGKKLSFFVNTSHRRTKIYKRKILSE